MQLLPPHKLLVSVWLLCNCVATQWLVKSLLMQQCAGQANAAVAAKTASFGLPGNAMSASTTNTENPQRNPSALNWNANSQYRPVDQVNNRQSNTMQTNPSTMVSNSSTLRYGNGAMANMYNVGGSLPWNPNQNTSLPLSNGQQLTGTSAAQQLSFSTNGQTAQTARSGQTHQQVVKQQQLQPARQPISQQPPQQNNTLVKQQQPQTVHQPQPQQQQQQQQQQLTPQRTQQISQAQLRQQLRHLQESQHKQQQQQQQFRNQIKQTQHQAQQIRGQQQQLHSVQRAGIWQQKQPSINSSAAPAPSDQPVLQAPAKKAK